MICVYNTTHGFDAIPILCWHSRTLTIAHFFASAQFIIPHDVHLSRTFTHFSSPTINCCLAAATFNSCCNRNVLFPLVHDNSDKLYLAVIGTTELGVRLSLACAGKIRFPNTAVCLSHNIISVSQGFGLRVELRAIFHF